MVENSEQSERTMKGPYSPSFRDPAVKVLVGLIAGSSVVVGILLMVALTDVGWTTQWKMFGRLPSERVVLRTIRGYDPSVEAAKDRGPFGFARQKGRVYDVQRDGEMPFMAVVVERDLDCSTCEDLLFMVLVDVAHQETEKVWVLAGLDDCTAPAQFVRSFEVLEGSSLADTLVFGEDVDADGVSGATKSAKALIEGLNETSVFLRTVHLTPEGGRRE